MVHFCTALLWTCLLTENADRKRKMTKKQTNTLCYRQKIRTRYNKHSELIILCCCLLSHCKNSDEISTRTHTHMHHFNGYFPGKPGLASCPLDSPVILILRVLTGQSWVMGKWPVECESICFNLDCNVDRTRPWPPTLVPSAECSCTLWTAVD